jgi:carbamoyl-phosphate synthase (ammonia)
VQGVPGLTGLDTRLLTRKIRSNGSIKGRIEFDGSPQLEFVDVNSRNLVAEVSVPEVRVFGKGNKTRVLAVDCGMKNNIIRELVKRGAEVTVVPWNHKFAAMLKDFDGLFLSNGPGDPTRCTDTIDELKKVLAFEGSDVRPIFGICLGNQLLALASGATTSKLPFGNRGQNQPVINSITGECYITPQNHGYAIDDASLSNDWKTLFTNANDGSNEGIMHTSKPYFSAQFHPEANCGPTDTAHLFDKFLGHCTEKSSKLEFHPRTKKLMGERPKVSKVLLLGSGGLSIGQAGEFDYSGAQAIKALKEEGLQVVLMNPNIASVQTNMGASAENQADTVFFLPVTPDFVEQVIAREKPDGIMISMGGQTALNCGIALHDSGVFERHGVTVLGTQIQTIKDTEDRQLFSDRIGEINERIAQSFACDNMAEALVAAKTINYPVMIRSAYSLGGLGSAICQNESELKDMGAKAFSMSPQILVEKSMLGWKEVEYEVVRDAWDNCVTVCNMENFDALGVHTGDSIVIAPSQTLSDREYHMLRETAIKVVRHLGIVGECNIQYALHPESLEYCIIEVNARLSRSSALASKATGYPLAFVAAKLSLGLRMDEIKNSVTKVTQACFEPSLDYCVTKIPRWDLSKFEGVSNKIGSAMKSVGEVMSIGRTWEESMQKAMRMVDPNILGFEPRRQDTFDPEAMETVLKFPTDRRIFAIAQGLYSGSHDVKAIHDLTDIDPWFLYRLEAIAQEAANLKSLDLKTISQDQMLNAKQKGFSDIQLSKLLQGGPSEDDVRSKRKAWGITPFAKQIDTLAGEFPADTNYLYMTYHGSEHDVHSNKDGYAVLGNGAYRIGSSVEFDWCAVSAIRTLRALDKRAVCMNYNPETVSTDYDECDQLYFEELSRERVLDVYEHEGLQGVIVSVGGQIPQNLAAPLAGAGVTIMGTAADQIDRAEDRFKFSAMLDRLEIEQPRWKELSGVDSALAFADEVTYPVLVRPSFVLSGAAMNVAHTPEQLKAFLSLASDVSEDKPVVISKFIEGAREIEMDAVCRNGEVVAAAVHEHIENAGVHSGDATLLLPPQDITSYTRCRIEEVTRKIAKELNITGPCNVQFITKGSDVLVIECNLRASRSFPFVSKTMGVDFIEAATKAMMGAPIDDMNLPALGDRNRPNGFVGCKAPMFSFTRLRGADPVLGVEMASTGEVACFGADKHEAFLKALLSTGFKLPEKPVLLSVHDSLQDDLVHSAWSLHEMGYQIYATDKTHKFLASRQVPSTLAHFPDTPELEPNVKTLLQEQEVGLVINLPTFESKQTDNNYAMRRTAVDFGIPLLTQPQLVNLFVESLVRHKKGELIGIRPDSLFDHYAKEKPEETWSGVTEFH